MASPADDAVIARWETENKEQQQQQNSNANSRSRKRQRLLPAAIAAIDLHTTRASSDNVNNNNRRAIEWDIDGAERRRAHSASPASETSDTGAGAADGLRVSSNSSRTWGERFTSWSFGNVEPEPEKTPPKKAVPTPATTSTVTMVVPQKAPKRIVVPKSQVSVKKSNRKKMSESGSSSVPVLGSTKTEPIPVLSDTENPD